MTMNDKKRLAAAMTPQTREAVETALQNSHLDPMMKVDVGEEGPITLRSYLISIVVEYSVAVMKDELAKIQEVGIVAYCEGKKGTFERVKTWMGAAYSEVRKAGGDFYEYVLDPALEGSGYSARDRANASFNPEEQTYSIQPHSRSYSSEPDKVPVVREQPAPVRGVRTAYVTQSGPALDASFCSTEETTAYDALAVYESRFPRRLGIVRESALRAAVEFCRAVVYLASLSDEQIIAITSKQRARPLLPR